MNSGQILNRYNANTGCILDNQWTDTGQILNRTLYCTNSGHIFDKKKDTNYNWNGCSNFSNLFVSLHYLLNSCLQRQQVLIYVFFFIKTHTVSVITSRKLLCLTDFMQNIPLITYYVHTSQTPADSSLQPQR